MAAPTTNQWVFWSAEQLLNDMAGDGGHSFVEFVGSPTEETTTTKHGPSALNMTTGDEVDLWHMDSDNRPWDDGSTPGDYTSAGGNQAQQGGCYFRISSLPGTTDTLITFTAGATVLGYVGIDTDGDLYLLNDALARVAEHTAAISVDTWYYIEWSVEFTGSSTTHRLWLDGSQQSGSQTFTSGTAGTVSFTGLTAGTTYLESMWIAWGAQTAAKFIDPGSCTLDINNDDGSGDAWTGTADATNKYNNVDDNQDSNYNFSSTQNENQTHGSGQDLSTKWVDTVITYEALFGYVGVHRRSSPGCNFSFVLNDGGNFEPATPSTVSPPRSTTAEHWARGAIDHQRPGTTNAWTEAAMEGTLVDYQHEQAQARELQVGYARIFVLVEFGESAVDTAKNLPILGVG